MVYVFILVINEWRFLILMRLNLLCFLVSSFYILRSLSRMLITFLSISHTCSLRLESKLVLNLLRSWGWPWIPHPSASACTTAELRVHDLLCILGKIVVSCLNLWKPHSSGICVFGSSRDSVSFFQSIALSLCGSMKSCDWLFQVQLESLYKAFCN